MTDHQHYYTLRQYQILGNILACAKCGAPAPIDINIHTYKEQEMPDWYFQTNQPKKHFGTSDEDTKHLARLAATNENDGRSAKG